MSDLGRILIADDEETFLRSTGALLRREGYECECAPDGATTEELLQNNDFDLLISDIKMPGNDNLDMVKRIAANNLGMPIILVTGYPSLDSALPSIELPVAAYLTKPIQFAELLAHVKAAIKQYRVYRCETCFCRREG